MIQALIFDCFGVLTTDTWREYLASVNPDIRQELRDLHSAFLKGFTSYHEFRASALELVKSSPTDFDNIFITHQGQSKNLKLLEQINTLESKYKIGILSNAGSSWIRDSFLSQKDQQMFDDIVLSYEVGLAKPDEDIYKLACQRLGVNTSQVVFVDDREDFCQAAESLGIRTIVYKDFVQFKHELDAILADSNN